MIKAHETDFDLAKYCLGAQTGSACLGESNRFFFDVRGIEVEQLTSDKSPIAMHSYNQHSFDTPAEKGSNGLLWTLIHYQYHGMD